MSIFLFDLKVIPLRKKSCYYFHLDKRKGKNVNRIFPAIHTVGDHDIPFLSLSLFQNRRQRGALWTLDKERIVRGDDYSIQDDNLPPPQYSVQGSD